MAIQADYEPKESNGNVGWYDAQKSQIRIETDSELIRLKSQYRLIMSQRNQMGIEADSELENLTMVTI